MRPKLSIIIASYKNPAILRLCVKSVKKTIKKLSHEIIVADGQTGEETYDLMRESFSSVTFIPNRDNVGFGALANQGLERAIGQYLLIINSDIIFKEGSIENMVKYLEDNPAVGMIGPKLINFDNSVQPSCFRFYRPMTIIYRRTFLGKTSFGKKHLSLFTLDKELAEKKDQPMKVDWIMGSAILTSAEAVKEVGLFDRRFFMYFEDVDWCRRFWERGYEVVYYPLAQAYHYHGKASKSANPFLSVLLNRYSRIHIYSGIKYFFKYLGREVPFRSS